MKKLILVSALFLSLNFSYATEKIKVADETTISITEKSFKVVTSNEVILNKLLSKFKDIERYSVAFKTDRLGRYKETTIPFKLTKLTEVKEFLKSL